jgi:glutamine synthetase
VAPGQYEVAPQFESANLAIDNNLFMMELLREVARKHKYTVLLAEKPFAGVVTGRHKTL